MGFSLAPLSSFAKCFQINEIDIRDSNILPKKIIHSIKARYETQCLDQDQINKLLRELTNQYIDNGYITTYPRIPEQNVQSGKLIIEINEGKIEDIAYKSNRRIKQNHVLPSKQDKILNLRDLEQSVDQFSTLTEGNKSKITIKPGKGKNSSIIHIDDIKDKVWQIKSGIDNYGSKNKGIEQYMTSIAVENLLKSNDQYNISHRQSFGDLTRRFSRTYSGGISIPYSYSNLDFNISHSAYRTYIHANGEQFRNAGSSKSYKVSLINTIHRDKHGKSRAIIAYGHDNYSNYISDTRLEISSYRIDKLEIGINHQRRLKSSVLAAGANYTFGMNNNFLNKFGDITKPHRKFYKLNYNLSWIKSLPMKPTYFAPQFSSSIVGQFTSQRLAGSEKISIGGISSVRGYKEEVENSDNGIYIRNELALGCLSKDKAPIFEDVEFFAALDVGRFANYEPSKEVMGMMSGYAFGIRNIKGSIKFDFTIGKAIKSKYIKPKDAEFYFSIGIDV